MKKYILLIMMLVGSTVSFAQDSEWPDEFEVIVNTAKVRKDSTISSESLGNLSIHDKKKCIWNPSSRWVKFCWEKDTTNIIAYVSKYYDNDYGKRVDMLKKVETRPDEKADKDKILDTEKINIPTLQDIEIKCLIDSLEKEIDLLKKETRGSNSQFPIGGLSFVFVLLLGGALYFVYSKMQKSAEAAQEELGKQRDSTQKLSERIDAAEQAQRAQARGGQTEEQTRGSISEEQIKRYIDLQIKSLTSQLQQQAAVETRQAPSTRSNRQTGDTSAGTENVNYNPDDNTFAIGPTTLRLFRIYASGNEYYYTLVDDVEVRREFLSMIPTFGRCITYAETNNSAQRVEPVKSGRLIPSDGNKFAVDENNKLEVRFV